MVLFVHHASKGVKILSNMNKSRIEILKMKAKRTGSRKELVDELSNIVTVSMDSFMDSESNDLFCKNLFNTLTQTSNIKTLVALIMKKTEDYQ